MEYVYYAQIELDEYGEWDVVFPDVPEVVTGGKTKRETFDNAREALGLALLGYIDRNQALPEQNRRKGLTPVPVLAHDALKIAVIEAFKEAGITKTQLGQRLGKQLPEIRRLLDPNHQTKMQPLERALSELGRNVIVSIDRVAA